MVTPESILKQYFGYESFRPMQKNIIDSVMNKRDTVVLMPTGGGKSVCYQVPALVLPGICIVVSPLIALMRDQVKGLMANGVPAYYINSSQSTAEQSEVERKCQNGEVKLLYVSPEKLMSQNFFFFMRTLHINLFAIDEAHCISAWGHDFRPEYTQLKFLKESFPDVPMIALTATADKLTRRDIATHLRLDDPQYFISSFDRKNLSLTVEPGIDRIKRIMHFLDSRTDEPGIIYCLSRKGTEMLAEKLTRSGYKAACYHAGLSADERSRVQDGFLKDDLQVICATIAFGMGIDKSNVRFVIHYNLPKNIESYYQEIGRAGRDGLPSDTLLFYSYADVAALRDMIVNAEPPLPAERQELGFAKLERMKQYAEANQCRRRILLNYFSEDLDKDCGNCDVCRNPRRKIDGTVIAQKALSAVARTREEVTATVLIDILRGHRTGTIAERGYDQIKTFGAGKDVRPEEWREYIQQMINMGLFEIAYDQKYALKHTPLAKKVLFEGKAVQLVQPDFEISKKAAAAAEASRPKTLKEEMFERLRRLRKRLADEQNVPPYVVFSDNTLNEMATERPMTRAGILMISGMSEKKFELYGDLFLKEITAFIKEKGESGKTVKGGTYLLTLEEYKKGLLPEEIAARRNLNIATIYSHFAALYEQGHDIDLKRFITRDEFEAIKKGIKAVGSADSNQLKTLFDRLGGKFEYHKLRFAMAIYNRQKAEA